MANCCVNIVSACVWSNNVFVCVYVCWCETEPFNHLSDIVQHHEWKDVQHRPPLPQRSENISASEATYSKQKQTQTTEPCDVLTEELLIKIQCTFFQQLNELLQKR